nr:hypothetical protein BgiMline_007970 [Biomphalaria glabrata]
MTLADAIVRGYIRQQTTKVWAAVRISYYARMTIMAIEVLSVSDKNVNNLLFSLYALGNRRRGQSHGQPKKEQGIVENKAE